MKVGIDFGGVIVRSEGEHQPFEPVKGKEWEQPGAINSIQSLVNTFGDDVWIISKASKKTQYATREWFANVRFFSENWFFLGGWCFVRNERKKEKYVDD